MRALESRTKGHGILVFNLVWLLTYCRTAAAQSSPTEEVILSHGPMTMTCSQVCNYDDWYKRAECNERNLYKVPSSEGCEKSTTLELRRNHISNISTESMDGYSNMKRLDLSENEITVVHPGSFSNMKMLQTVVLSKNNLQELVKNATFAGTENTLKRIYLDQNGIVKLSNCVFFGLRALIGLYLNHNKIQNLPPTIFHGLNELEFLQLSMNKLNHVDMFIFQNLTKLKILSLNDNKLTSIPNRLFQGLHSLQEVALSNNAIVAIPSPESVGIISIQRLYLDNNNITHSSNIIPYLNVTQERLNISHNPLTCDCAFQFIQEWWYNNSQGNSLRDPVICILNDIRYNIIDPMPFTCETPQATPLSTDPMADLLSETTTQMSDTTRYHSNTDDMISASKCNFNESKKCPYNQEWSCKNMYDKVRTVPVYSAICLTIFFVAQMAFNTKVYLFLKQKFTTVTGV